MGFDFSWYHSSIWLTVILFNYFADISQKLVADSIHRNWVIACGLHEVGIINSIFSVNLAQVFTDFLQ